MKIKLLIGRSGADSSVPAGKEIDVSDKEALVLIQSVPPKAEAVDDKEYQKAIKKVKAEEKKTADKNKEMELLLQKEELEAEKVTLEARLAEINEILEVKTK